MSIYEETTSQHIFRQQLKAMCDSIDFVPPIDKLKHIIIRYGVTHDELAKMRSFQVRAKSVAFLHDITYLQGQIDRGACKDKEAEDSIKLDIEVLKWVKAIVVIPFVMYWDSIEGAA